MSPTLFRRLRDMCYLRPLRGLLCRRMLICYNSDIAVPTCRSQLVMGRSACFQVLVACRVTLLLAISFLRFTTLSWIAGNVRRNKNNSWFLILLLVRGGGIFPSLVMRMMLLVARLQRLVKNFMSTSRTPTTFSTGNSSVGMQQTLISRSMWLSLQVHLHVSIIFMSTGMEFCLVRQRQWLSIWALFRHFKGNNSRETEARQTAATKGYYALGKFWSCVTLQRPANGAWSSFVGT